MRPYNGEKMRRGEKGRWGVNQQSKKRDIIRGWCLHDVGNPTDLLEMG